MSIGSVIRYNLLDNIDSTAQEAYLANTSCYSSSADVPVWIYTSLATLLGCPSANIGSFVIADLGEAKTPTNPCIIIETGDIIEGVDVSDGLRSDMVGQDETYIKILVNNVKTNKNFYLVKNTLMRIRYLLDANIRQYGTPIRYADLEINSNEFLQPYFRCYYQRMTLPVASEGLVEFKCCLFFNFGVSDS